MKDERDIELLVERWLDEQARPMPAYILESVLEAVPRASRLRPGGRSWLGLAGQRALAVGFVGAAVVIAVVGAPLVINAPKPTGPGVVGGSPTPTGDGARLEWNPAAEFRRYPNQMNPSPDSYDHPDVWTYGYGTTAPHDPSGYELFVEYDSAREIWDKPGFFALYVGAPGTGISIHPYALGQDFRSAIVGWRSPIAGSVTITGEVRLNDTTCTRLGSGIVFSIDQNGRPLQTITVPTGGRQDFRLTAIVSPGDPLYFVVDPGADSSCDATLLSVAIRKP